ncbi:putative bifunctional diguanylate cyclase/phosphodiesterase [Qipengyuania thermophila]|uniref:putative bifunctional diguanylate cyclase/phosphodiesterase n=1 Tax=Qipengyuania thermophila TaxID=2509361 RepID=UPI001F3B5F0F|nr:EAL domain-containing protein [Qipengyuania thermophila]
MLHPSVTAGELSWRNILGLNAEARRQWADLAGFRGEAVTRWTLFRALCHLIAFVVSAWLFAGADNWLVFAAVGVALAINTGLSLRQGPRKWRGCAMTGVASGARQQIMVSTIAGLVWAIPLILMGATGSLHAFLGMQAIVLTLVIAASMNDTAPPLTAIGFTIASMLGAVAGSLLQQQVILSLVPVVVSVLTSIGTYRKSRTLLAARLTTRRLADTSDTVSLLLREFEENGADWLWQIDGARRLRGVSPRFAFALGMTADEAEGKPFLQVIGGMTRDGDDTPHGLRELAEKLKRQESFSDVAVSVEVGGQLRWWELSGTPIYDEKNAYVGFRGVGSDITERRESDEKIAFLARYDMLTRLPNRVLLTERLGEALKHCQRWRSRCALMMLDLDRFKAVNDTLGHLAGDRLLSQVATRLQSITSGVAMAGRLGGDEFAVVLDTLDDSGQAEKLARLIIERLSEPYLVDGQTLYIGASVGSAIGPRDGNSVEELMRNADLALYQAKDDGGGSYCEYEPALHQLAEERRKLELALRSALARGEMQLVFQPVVDANGEHLVSFEALLRWQNKEFGTVSPAKFIPLAEDTRLIVPIGEWVLEQACIEAARWPEHIMVNVNVSPAQLLDANFVPNLTRILDSTALKPSRLEIEVTESVFMADPTVARMALEQAMALGCSIALDDFGTGYSSLGYLRTLRFSTIKVDRLFVQGAAHGNRESLAIIRAVVAMSDSLGMTTTAEGVENGDEAALIRSLGCTKIQGYHFGRPMEADQARSLMRRESFSLSA